MKDTLKEKYKGLKFNMLTSVRYVETKNNKPIWIFLCDCGKEVSRRFEAVKLGVTVNCGCIKKERKKYLIVNERKPRKKTVKNLDEVVERGTVISVNNLFKEYKRSSLKRKHSFEINIDYFKKLIFNNCFYCKSEPSQLIKLNSYKELRKGILYNGIDRVINTIGYTVENTVSCCGWCNRAKGKNTQENFFKYLKRVKSN